MILSVAGNNSINRWKEGAGIPQSSGGGSFGSRRPGSDNAAAERADVKTERPVETAHSYLTPTSVRFQNIITKVAPVTNDPKTGKPTSLTVFHRPTLESRAEVEKALDSARKRTPRLPLTEEAEARQIVPEGFPEGALPQWVRLLANFPNSAKNRISSIVSSESRGDLAPLLKAQVSWIIARQDRAWYATGQAKQRLNELGLSDDQIYLLDGDWSEFSPAERSLFKLARNLAAAPIVLTDEDVADALAVTGPREVVQIITYTTNRASFNRITESAGLQIEE